MTMPTAAEFHLEDRRALHIPTGAAFIFPISQPWRSNGFSKCWVHMGLAESDLPDGAHYRLRDLIETARDLLMARALAQPQLNIA